MGLLVLHVALSPARYRTECNHSNRTLVNYYDCSELLYSGALKARQLISMLRSIWYPPITPSVVLYHPGIDKTLHIARSIVNVMSFDRNDIV